MRNTGIALAAVVLALGPSIRSASNPSHQQFQQAIDLLQKKDNPAAAAVVFENLSHGPDRDLAAQALLYLGECRERAGRQRAIDTYRRILREFADRPEAAAEARRRIALLESGPSPSAGIVIRKIWALAPDNSGNPSADGRLLTFVDWETGDVAVRDLATGKNRRLTQKGAWRDSPEYAEWPKISADGKKVAYSWATANYGHQLRVVETDGPSGAQPQIVLQNPDLHYIIPWAWSSDDKSVIVLLSRGDDTNQLAWVSVPNGAVRPLKSLEWQSPTSVSLSPDGRFLVYDLPQSNEGPEQDIFIMAADGSREFPLVRHPADDYAPVWTPDGSSVLFASTRTGAVGIWGIPVAEGRPAGPPELLKGGLGQITPLGITRRGALFYAEHRGMDDIFEAEIDPATGKVRGSPVRLVETFIGRNSAPVWSPDGRFLAYFSNRNPAHAYGVGTADIVIRSMEGGAERIFSGASLDLRQAVRWMPDGRSLLVTAKGTDTRARAAFSLVNLATGEFRIVTRSNVTLPFAAVHPEGRSFFVAGGDQNTNLGTITSYDVATGEGREVYRAPAGWVLRNLALSRDGRMLAFSVADPELQRNVIYTMPSTGGAPREVVRLTNSIAREGLAWSVDGRYLFLVETGRAGGAELFRVKAEGGAPETTGISARGLSLISAHPDGAHIAYTVGQYFQIDVWDLENFLPALPAFR
jgi:Tol biopolymer transport system component